MLAQGLEWAELICRTAFVWFEYESCFRPDIRVVAKTRFFRMLCECHMTMKPFIITNSGTCSISTKQRELPMKQITVRLFFPTWHNNLPPSQSQQNTDPRSHLAVTRLHLQFFIHRSFSADVSVKRALESAVPTVQLSHMSILAVLEAHENPSELHLSNCLYNNPPSSRLAMRIKCHRGMCFTEINYNINYNCVPVISHRAAQNFFLSALIKGHGY